MVRVTKEEKKQWRPRFKYMLIETMGNRGLSVAWIKMQKIFNTLSENSQYRSQEFGPAITLKAQNNESKLIKVKIKVNPPISHFIYYIYVAHSIYCPPILNCVVKHFPNSISILLVRIFNLFLANALFISHQFLTHDFAEMVTAQAQFLYSPNNCKILHMVRHGQGVHNVEAEKNIDALLSPELFDSPISALGWQQVADLRKYVHATGLLKRIDLVVTSPLLRSNHYHHIHRPNFIF